MDIPQNLTPFSQSILSSAMPHALRRTASYMGVSVNNISANMEAPSGVHAFLAAMTTAVWGASPRNAADMLGVDPVQPFAHGKTGHGIKSAQRTLGDFPKAYDRMKQWSEWVFASEWNQAQLLQVMEEIEPMVSEALMWIDLLAIAAAGSYTHLGELIAKFEKDETNAHALRLGLTAGLETPDGKLVGALEAGITKDALRKNFGHRAISQPCEIALPRIEEAADRLVGNQQPPESMTWNIIRAQQRQQEALQEAIARVGWLGRSGLKKMIGLTQSALVAHANARDGLAYVLAATRHWAKAAADEGMSNGRIHSLDEIFMLEIEEIKQMMTGEWHSREHVEPLITKRQERQRQRNETSFPANRALGVAGNQTQGRLAILSTPETTIEPTGLIALASGWSPAWWRAILMTEGVISLDGNLLSWIAAVARMGDLPTIVAGSTYAEWPAGSVIQLVPSRNQAIMLD